MNTSTAPSPEAFRHEALLYAGDDEFVEQAAGFIGDSVDAGEAILVVVDAVKIDRLRRNLGGDPDGVRFADMAAVGRNPARIIPAWHEFVAHTSDGGRVRGIGEPIWAGRSPDELVECERHEALLNLAFAGTPAWWLVCPYDTTALPAEVIEEAQRNHPYVLADGEHRDSGLFRDLASIGQPFDHPLPEPRAHPAEVSFGRDRLSTVRDFVANHAAAYSLDRRRRDDLILAVNELATNSIRHGGGGGTLRIWRDEDTVVCEVNDEGRIDDPMVGRRRPGSKETSGFGLWLVNQLCDLVQVRSFTSGTTVRVHLSVADPMLGTASSS